MMEREQGGQQGAQKFAPASGGKVDLFRYTASSYRQLTYESKLSSAFIPSEVQIIQDGWVQVKCSWCISKLTRFV